MKGQRSASGCDSTVSDRCHSQPLELRVPSIALEQELDLAIRSDLEQQTLREILEEPKMCHVTWKKGYQAHKGFNSRKIEAMQCQPFGKSLESRSSVVKPKPASK